MYKNETARGFVGSLQTVPTFGPAKPDTPGWLEAFTSLPAGLDFVRSAQGKKGSLVATEARRTDPAKALAFSTTQATNARRQIFERAA
ncbi:BQ2448_5212 [Microbotryum intermedium]|uniref:BQ2448_5205 protein n=1 Tax=Microbotryum intermedium TaxID=269621 RepID=A0A238F6D3_9BASI|nr:BQ2448_5205 [Microbotryum intermedium]SCV67601.1 BQ2448_5212 [Microbotryum intermedium]